MTGKTRWNGRIWMGMLALVMVLFLGLTAEQFSFVSQAQSQGKVTASSANIRKEPSANSQSLGSAANGAAVTINGQTTGSDGKVWYQVFVNADTLGYIRSDLVAITDGSTPDTLGGSETSGGNTQDGVEAVEPVSATVKGGQRVRVRAAATTDSAIVTAVENGSALTVTGQAQAADGNTWYYVEFIENGADVAGFIRSDFVELSGELVVVAPEEPDTTEPEPTEPDTTEPEVTKDWETQLQGEDWYLLDMANNGQYKISDIFAAVNTNKAAYEAAQKTVKSQKLVIVILILLILALGGAAAFLVYKIKDMMDSAYYSQVEKETLRKRSDRDTNRPQSSQKVMHTVGAEKKPAGAPQGTRPAGAPQGTRPAGAPQGARPAGAPQGARPAGAPQGARPAGAPQGTKPAGAPQGTKPAGAPQGTKPAGAPQGAQPAAKPQPAEAKPQDPKANTQPQNWKAKNFANDDDEFEFEFLNWDGEEE